MAWHRLQESRRYTCPNAALGTRRILAAEKRNVCLAEGLTSRRSGAYHVLCITSRMTEYDLVNLPGCAVPRLIIGAERWARRG